MLGKREALEIVLLAVPAPSHVQEVPLEHAPGRVLARDALADMDMPPFEKSSMDGWAVRAADVAVPGARLAIRGRIMAGSVPPGGIGSGETMKIMTGAPLPEGADAVVMVEHSREDSAGASVTLDRAASPGENVCHRGEDLRRGEVLLPAGSSLDAEAAGLLAMVGIDPVPVYAAPTVAVIPTGDELVEPGGPPPAPGMIRESNGALLAAQVRRVSPALHAVRPGIARDDEASLGAMLDVGLGHDVLCLSGGVSMGDLDLVGRALRERGLEVLVERVAIKPGKPLLFGRLRRAEGHICHVFGLPGNPVSTYVTFELFVRPFLLRCLGHADVMPDEVTARYGGGGLKKMPRTQHVPAIVTESGGALVAAPLEWHGSADLRGIVDANAFIIVEAREEPPEEGGAVCVHLIPGRGLHAPASRTRTGG